MFYSVNFYFGVKGLKIERKSNKIINKEIKYIIDYLCVFELMYGWFVNDFVVGFSVIIVKEKGYMLVCYCE